MFIKIEKSLVIRGIVLVIRSKKEGLRDGNVLGVANIFQGCKSLSPYMKRIENRIKNNIKNLQVGHNLQIGDNLQVGENLQVGHNLQVGENLHVDNKLVPFSEQWCKEKKAEIFRNGFPAIFQDMSKMKEQNYFAINKFIVKPLSLFSLKGKPGVYMITNKVNKKFYIGMSTNLNKRFYNYLDENRLKQDRSSRINKALIKYGFENFSITILELPHISDTKDDYLNRKSSYFTLKGNNRKSSYLRNREDFFIKVFKPQYNIKRSLASRDLEFFGNKAKVKWEIPIIIKNLLDKCLDPEYLSYNLLFFVFNSKKRFYRFAASTPKKVIKAKSSGWFEGKIQNSKGFETLDPINVSISTLIKYHDLIDKEKLALFYEDKEHGYVKKSLNSKLKALKMALKKEDKFKEIK